MSDQDERVQSEQQDDPSAALLPFDDQGGRLIRRQWHEGRWFFSVVDVIAVLTDSSDPGTYWRVLKSRLQAEGATETVTRIVQLKMPALDGKMREADCADGETLQEICRLIPAAALWRRKDRTDDIVYAIGLSDGSMVKIGTTTDLTARLRSLQNSSPVPLVLVWQMPGDGSLERRLHTYFAHRRAHGEWFSFADVDVVPELHAALVAIGSVQRE